MQFNFAVLERQLYVWEAKLKIFLMGHWCGHLPSQTFRSFQSFQVWCKYLPLNIALIGKMPLKVQSVGTSILHQSINHCSVLLLWDLWHIFCMHLTWSQRRAGALQTSSHVPLQLWLSLGVCTQKEAPVCQKLPEWVWVGWEKFTVVRSGQGTWFSPLKGLFAMMGNTIPFRCLVVLESWAAQRKPLTGSGGGTGLFCLSSHRWALEAAGQHPLCVALLCFACVVQGKARKLGENRRAVRSELSAACETSPAKEKLWGRW